MRAEVRRGRLDYGVRTLFLTWNAGGIGDEPSARQQGHTVQGEQGRTVTVTRVEPDVGRTP